MVVRLICSLQSGKGQQPVNQHMQYSPGTHGMQQLLAHIGVMTNLKRLPEMKRRVTRARTRAFWAYSDGTKHTVSC